MTLLKQLLLTVTVSGSILFASEIKAQIADPGFENWSSQQQGSFFNYLPKGWGEYKNILCGMEGKEYAVTKTEDAHSGSFALQLKNIALEDFNSPTMLSSKSGSEDDFNNKIPVNKRHKSLSGYFKYSSPSADTFTIAVMMIKNDRFVGFGELKESKQTSTYKKFSLTINYLDENVVPDSAAIVFTAGSYENFVAGTTLILDDVDFDLSSGLTESNKVLNAKINAWPNPSKGNVNLNIDGELDGNVTVEIFDMLGKNVKRIILSRDMYNGQTNIMLNELPTGVLFVKVSDNNGLKALRLVCE